MISLGTAIFIAFVVGSVLKIVVRFYNVNKEEPRPFNWDYIRPIITSVVTGFPAIIADFMVYTPVGGLDHLMIVALALMAGYGATDGYKGLLEYIGLIDKALNKAKELDDSYGSP